ncbi:MAG: transcription antitermination factor NusB [Planctomycetota bacterium]
MDRQTRVAMLMDHQKRPRHRGPLPDADVRMPGGNPGCGDVVTLHLRADGDRLAELTFEGEGCTISQAAASILAQRMNREQPSFREILELDYEEMIELLGRDIVGSRPRCATLALGTLKRRATLDAVLRAFLLRPGKPLPAAVETTLHLALYQILLLDRVPAFAAVNEAVNRARRAGKAFASLANGVLRSVVRDLAEPEEGPIPAARNIIPIGYRRFRRIGRDVFPDPDRHPAAYVAAAYSLPEELTARWLKQFGSLKKTAEVALYADLVAPLICRVNPLLAAPAEILAELREQGVDARMHANGVSIVITEGVDVTRLDAFQRGAIQPQDAGATFVGLQANPSPGMRVMDFCAAPGTKTTHLAEMMRNKGQITAVDVSPEKLARVEENVRRMGVEIVDTQLADFVGGLEAQSYDLVLVDAACSNTGVLARRPEARWRFSAGRLAQLVADQQFLAAAGAGFVRPGGRLVYSVCSIEPEEGGRIAHSLENRLDHVRLVREQLYLPEASDDPALWQDGGYVAILEVR